MSYSITALTFPVIFQFSVVSMTEKSFVKTSDGFYLKLSDIEHALSLAVKCVYGFFQDFSEFNVNVTHDDGLGYQRVLATHGDFKLKETPADWGVCKLNPVPGNDFILNHLDMDIRTKASPLVTKEPSLRTYVG